jgi:hypothetical protein
VGTTKGFAAPKSFDLVLALEKGKAESHLPGLPRMRPGWEAFPIIDFMWEVMGCKDSCQCHHDKFDIGDRHAGPLSLFLGILHHDNELGDTIHLHVVLHHVRAKQDHVKGMKLSTVGVKEGHDVDGCDLCVEGVSVFEVVVPNLVDAIAEKLGHASFGCLVTGIVIKLGFVGSLLTNLNDCHGVGSDCLVVEWETNQAYKLGTLVGFVLDSLGEDGCEGVNSIQLVIGDDHEQWEKGFMDGQEVIIGRLPFKGGERVMGLFEEASDCVGHHVGLLCFRHWVGAVKDCNDGNEGNCVGKGQYLVPTETCLSP